MGNTAVVHMGENSPEHVAYKLMKHVADLEKRSFNPDPEVQGWKAMDRTYLLDTFAECLKATRGNRLLQRTQ